MTSKRTKEVRERPNEANAIRPQMLSISDINVDMFFGQVIADMDSLFDDSVAN